MGRGLCAVLVVLLASLAARAQPTCTETQPCLHTIGSPSRYASIAPHRLLVANGELVWASFIDLHALDLATGQARTLRHCGTAITDIALDDGWVYVLADRALLCRVSLASDQVQMLVNVPDVTVWGFAVSSSVVAYAMRHRGDQPEVHVVSWSSGQSRSFPTWVTVEHLVAAATSAYWIDAGFLTRVDLSTGTKTVGPRLAGRVTRLVLASGKLYAATEQEVLRLDAASRTWVTVAPFGADDLVASGRDVYAASPRHGVLKIGASFALLGPRTRPYALSLDGASVVLVEDNPFTFRQLVPR